MVITQVSSDLARQKLVIKYLGKRTGEIKRMEYPNEMLEYILSTASKWINAVASERVEVKAGHPTVIRIDPIELSPKEITLTCPISRHALGILLGLYGSEGKPQPVEGERLFDKAIFLPLRDGVVEEGDLLGVINAVTVHAVLERRVIRAWTPHAGLTIY